jgi:ABC-type multidrug transport system fused ATPase/permease subunit
MYRKLLQIRHLLGNDYRKLPFLITLFLIASLVELIGIGLVGPYISLITGGPEFIWLNRLISDFRWVFPDWLDIIEIIGLLLILVFIGKTVLAIWITKRLLEFSIWQEVRIRALLMNSYQKINYEKFINRNSSDYLYGIQILATQFSVNIVMPVMKMLSEGIIILFILIFLGWVNYFALILILSLLVFTVYGYDLLFKEKIRYSGERANIENIAAIQSAKEGLLGLKEIRILGKESFFYDRLHAHSIEYSRYLSKATLLANVPKYMLELILVSFLVIFVIITKYLSSTENLIATLAVFGFAAMRLIPAAYSCSHGISQIRHGSSSLELLYKDLEKFPNTEIENLKDISSINFRSIKFDNVSFSYQNKKNLILENVSFKINKGDVVGFIGPSGAGKTTTIDLILGLLNPTNGEILVNENSLNLKEQMQSWQAQVAYLPQQAFILDDSVEINVTLESLKNNVSMENFLDALEKSKLKEAVESWALGKDTRLGENGLSLSGGQRQRIAIARAFYQNKEVIIFDESTSSLDENAENEIMKEIKNLKGKKTILIISHKHSSLDFCDYLLKVENGKIVRIKN